MDLNLCRLYSSDANHYFRVDPHACREPRSHPSFPPSILSIVAVALKNSAFVWMAFSRSNVSSTKDCQSRLKTYCLVQLALSLCSAFGSTRPVLSSNKFVLSSHAFVVKGGTLYACPPITGPGSKCQNSVETCKEYIFHYRKWLRKLYLQHEQHPHER